MSILGANRPAYMDSKRRKALPAIHHRNARPKVAGTDILSQIGSAAADGVHLSDPDRVQVPASSSSTAMAWLVSITRHEAECHGRPGSATQLETFPEVSSHSEQAEIRC